LASLYYLKGVVESDGMGDVMLVDKEQNNAGASAENYEYSATWNNPYYTMNTSTEPVELVDGTTVNTTVYTAGSAYTMDPFIANHTFLDDGILVLEPGVASGTEPTANNSEYVYHEQYWRDVWTATQSEHDYVTNNSMTYIEDVYANYNDGDFDSTDAQKLQSACSLNTLASDKDTTGSLDWARSSAVLAGYNTSANSSWTVDYTPATGETFYGQRSLSATAQNVTVSQPTLGDGALVTGDEQYAVNVQPASGTSVSNASLVLEDSDGTVVTSAALTDENADGRYTAALPAANVSTVNAGETLTPVVEFDADDGTSVTTTQVVMAGDGTDIQSGWTYAPNGGQSVTLSGALMTDWEPTSTNGSFNVNSTYDTANAGGESVIFLDSTQDGQAPGYYTLNGTFTVTSLYNAETGESVNSTTMEDYNTQSFNASLTQDEVNRVLDSYYEDKYESLWDTGNVTLGGSGGAFSGLADALGVGGFIVLGVLGLILYASRSQ
jgi:hypothetical protein